MAKQQSNPMTDLALITVFAALITAFSILPAIPLAFSPVPITLQTLAIGLTAMIIGPWRGALATLLWLVVGFAGLPVFAGGASGIGVLARATGGYLIAFPIYAVAVGWLSAFIVRRGLTWAVALLFAAGMAGLVVIVYPLGIVGMHVNAGLGWGKSLALNLPFLPGDTIKALLSASIAVAVHKAFPAILVARTHTHGAAVAH